jgi:hypothetical protein
LFNPLLATPSSCAACLMPEFRECLAHFLYLFWLFHNLKTDWTLLGLWADLTQAEAERTNGGNTGLVQRLNPTSTFKRGQTKHQTPLYPSSLRNSGDIASNMLVLNEIDHTPRAIILDFKSLRFKVRVNYAPYSIHTHPLSLVAFIPHSYISSSSSTRPVDVFIYGGS